MNRNLYMALVASFMAHGLLLLLLMSISPGGNTVLGVASTSPALNYRFEMQENSSPAGKPINDTEPVSQAPIAQNPPPPPQVADSPTPITKPERRPTPEQQVPVVPLEQTLIDAVESVAEIPTSPAPEMVSPPAIDLDIVTALVLDDMPAMVVPPQAHEPMPVKQPLSKKQEKMLNKKLRKLTESLHQGDMQNDSVVWVHKGQEYTAKFHSQGAVTDTSIDRVLVEISTEENGQKLSTELRMKRLAFSSFAQLINRWDPNVQLHDDELEGRFHANSAISIKKTRGVTPTFHGKVTTAARKVDIKRSGGSVSRDDIFLGGLETGVRRIGLPKRYVPFAANHTVDEQQIHRIVGDTRIVFYANGTYDWGPVDESTLPTKQVMSDATTYIVGGHKTRLFVSGTVKGRVLVCTPDDIVIEQELLYAHDPVSTPDGDDYLGLVSDKNVEIAHPDVTGPGDLRIYASIFAKRKFSVKHYRTKQDSVLYVYGSITAGSMTATEPRYYTKIEYDPRLEEMRAPGFPQTNRYEMVSWDRQWSFTAEDEPVE